MFFAPTARPRSTRRTEKFSRARARAAALPAGPAPTTTASNRSAMETRSREAVPVLGFWRERDVGPDLELAEAGAHGAARDLLAEDVRPEEALHHPRGPSRPQVAHGLGGWAVRGGERAVLDLERVPPFGGSERRHHRPAHADRRPDVRHPLEGDEGLLPGGEVLQTLRHRGHHLLGRALPGEVQDALRGRADRRLELLLDRDEELEAEEHDPVAHQLQMALPGVEPEVAREEVRHEV